MNRSCRTPS
jgi:hypothetical protein